MKIKYLFKYGKDYLDNLILKCFYKKPKVLSDEQTINYIINNKVSIARYGDGELRLMRGIDLEFQKHDKKLAIKLKNISTTDKCLVCIPCIFDKVLFNNTILTDEEFNYWNKFKKRRGGLWYYYFKNSTPLGDAFISRFYIRKKQKEKVSSYVEKLKNIWKDRNIIFVEGEKSRLGVGNDLFNNAKSIKRILCPATDAFNVYEKIKQSILKNSNKDDLIIMAIGPTATALAYELSPRLQCLDLGHIDIEYEWFKMNATKKQLVKNKFVNEVAGGNVVDESEDNQYKEQIIDKIL